MRSFLPAGAIACLLALPIWPQSANVLSVQPPPMTALRAGSTSAVRLQVRLQPGYHVNSHTPSDEYLIPLRLTWTAEPLTVAGVEFPKPKMEKYAFAEKPLSVFTGDFPIVTRFQVPAGAPRGARFLAGKLRYQACNTTTCLAPKTVEVRLPVDIQ